MFCTNCGSQNPDSATVCSACGMALGNPYQASQVRPGFDSPGMQPNIPNYLVPAILATICCCLPFGIVAIVYAAQVGSKLAAGDFEGARVASNNARTWCWLAFALGLISTPIFTYLRISALHR